MIIKNYKIIIKYFMSLFICFIFSYMLFDVFGFNELLKLYIRSGYYTYQFLFYLSYFLVLFLFIIINPNINLLIKLFCVPFLGYLDSVICLIITDIIIYGINSFISRIKFRFFSPILYFFKGIILYGWLLGVFIIIFYLFIRYGYKLFKHRYSHNKNVKRVPNKEP